LANFKLKLQRIEVATMFTCHRLRISTLTKLILEDLLSRSSQMSRNSVTIIIIYRIMYRTIVYCRSLLLNCVAFRPSSTYVESHRDIDRYISLVNSVIFLSAHADDGSHVKVYSV